MVLTNVPNKLECLFVPGKLFEPSVMSHSNLLDPFITYKENEVLLIWLLASYSQHFICFVSYDCGQ